MTLFLIFVLIQRHLRRHSKVQRHHDLIKVTCREIGKVYKVMLKQVHISGD